jgi:hypothetical protein
MTPRRHPWQRVITIFGRILFGASVVALSAPTGSAATPVSDPVAACASLANLTNFPVTPTQITSAI